jgi:hypothetical protein
VRLLMFIAVVVFLFTGCSEASTPQEQPSKDIEKAEKQPGKKSTDNTGADPAPTQQNTSRGQSPQEVLTSQYQHINAGDYEAAYELFDNRSQQLVSLEQYRAYFVSVAPYQITNHSFASVQVQGDTARLVVDLSVSSSTGEDQYRVTQRMVREDGSWSVRMRDEQVPLSPKWEVLRPAHRLRPAPHLQAPLARTMTPPSPSAGWWTATL